MAAAPARPSTILDRYRVRRVVGAGSFGRVLEVIDLGTDERRALKVVPPGPHEGTLLAELEQLARLAHPSLPRVFDVGRTVQPIAMPGFDDLPAGSPFFVAEWIDGARCDERPLPDLGPALWALLADVASALATIHGAGIVHADVAPQNVLVDGARAVLVDLGLAASAIRATDVRGTPAYMAPEALTGRLEPRSDLYGLGAIAIRVATGKPPFEAATLGELVQRIVTGGAARPLPGVPAPLADLIGRLVAREPDRRPASALAVLDELDAMAPVIAPASARRARPDVGPAPAPSTWPGAAAWIDELVASLARSRAIAIVVGDPGSGSRELVDAAVLRLQLDSVARQRTEARTRGTIIGTLEDVARELGVVQAASRGVEADARSWLERVARALRTASAPVVLELGDDPRLADVVAALDRSTGDRAIAIVVDRAPDRQPLPDDAASPLSLHPALVLDDAGVRALAETIVGTTLTPASTAALRAATGGRPAEVVELVRSLADELRTRPGELDWSTRTVGTAVERAAAALRGASPAARSLAAAVAAWGGRIPAMRALETARADADVGLAEVAELQRASLLRRRGDELALDRTALEAVEQVTGRDRIAAIADRELARLVEPAPAGPLERKPMHRVSLDRSRLAPPLPRELAALLERAPLDRARAELACKIAGDLLATGRADRALALARRAIATAPASANLAAARAAAALGGYRDAIALATAATAAGADAVESELVAARAAQRAGELDRAESALAKLHAAHPAHPEVAGAYARLLVTRSRYADARRIATAGGPLAGLRAEAAGLAAFYVGELDAADTAFAALETTAAATDDSPGVARALSLRGMVAQQRGQLGLASDRYREAARRLHDAGEVHGAAVAELNLGTILAERGRASDALPRLAAAGRVFAALAATTESIAADLNRGNALLAVGQADEARRAAEAALARAERVPHLRAFALLVAGDAHRRLDDDATALRLYREALAIGRERRDAHAQLSAHVALAEAGQLDSQGVDVDALCASDDDRDRWTIARGRLALRHGAPHVQAWLELARACAQVAVRAEESDRLERAFRGHAVASRLAVRGDDRARARAEAERARSIHATWIGVTAPAFRTALDRDPDLADLDVRTAPPTTSAPHAEPLPLRRLLALSRRLNSEASVARILDEVIDTAIELSSAERGFLLLRQADGTLLPVVSRNFTAGDLDPASAASVSRSIAESAARTGEPVVTVDAGIDERFGAAASVAALRLRSVLAVPLRQRGTVTGCIYVDHRLRGNAFDDAAVAILGELGDIAAIAIENARLADELRRTTAEVEALNARLAEDLAERDAELARVKSELPDRERLGGRYERIVGRSPAMLRMLEIVDRAAATALPVVIVGESGTGKELIAKALHDHGARRDGPFVAINCSAVPEPLLESELFGHVRGAFTGADRDRRGLFEVADGGTLFLDEIADTSMAMQAKLLRVLQDGMLRRVGDTRPRKVDVRIVAASQQPLGVLVAAGRFREDLRFRIEVINVQAPPLRERDGDIPLLVEQLLARMTAGRPAPRITRAALRALTQHGWPGNVRELENALARGLAMGGDVIDLADLPESIAHVSARPEPGKPATGEDLKLKPALLATEQAYIGAAMTRAKGNQTVAARLLGLSRFGLQKKLRRLSGADDDDSDD